MKNRLCGIALLLFLAAHPLSAQPLPGSGELEKTDWSLKKDDVAASLSARVKATASITADKISYTVTDLAQGLLNDGAHYLFTKTGVFKESSLLRTFNLEKEKSPQFFKDFATVTIEQYVKKLGKPDVDTTKTADLNGAQLIAGTLVWQANPKRTVAPASRIEIRIIASGTLVFYTESCTNSGVK
jgi:hypothetical protein